jgi:hypothetical protein
MRKRLEAEVKHEPVNNGEDIVCLIDGKIWPHIWPGRRKHVLLNTQRIGKYLVFEYENRIQPFTIETDGHIIKFCKDLNEVRSVIRATV